MSLQRTSVARTGLVFRERFNSLKSVVLSGGVLFGGATISAGTLSVDGGSTSGLLYYSPPGELDEFFARGGTVRLRLTHTNGAGAAAQRVFTYCSNVSANFNLIVIVTSANIVVAQLQDGASRFYYSATPGAMADGTPVEVVITWSTTGTKTLTVYFDSVSQVVDTSAAGGATYTAEGVTGIVHVGRTGSATGSYTGSVHAVDVFVGNVLTTGEMTALANNSLAKDLMRSSQIYLPFDATYTDTTLRTPNYGVLGGYAVVGDGTTSSTFPNFVEAPNGILVDGGDYVDTGLVDTINYNTPFTIAFGVRQKFLASSQGLISTMDTSISGGRGMELGFTASSGNHTLRIQLFSTSSLGIIGTVVVKTQSSDFEGIVVCTYSGNNNLSGFNMYVDREKLSLTNGANNLGTNTTLSGRSMLVGCSHNGVNKTRFTGNGTRIYTPCYWNTELSPLQAKIVTEEISKRIKA